MTYSVVTHNIQLTCSARWTEVTGRQAGTYAFLELLWKYSIFFFLHLMGSLGVALRLQSCVFVMLLPPGAKALTQTFSGRSRCQEINTPLKVLLKADPRLEWDVGNDKADPSV